MARQHVIDKHAQLLVVNQPEAFIDIDDNIGVYTEQKQPKTYQEPKRYEKPRIFKPSPFSKLNYHFYLQSQIEGG